MSQKERTASTDDPRVNWHLEDDSLPSVEIPVQVGKPRSLKANVIWTLCGNFIYAFSQWAMLVCIAKLGDPTMVGQFAFGLAVSAPIYMFTNMQLRSVQATDAKSEYRFSEYFGLRMLASVAGLLAVCVVSARSSSMRTTALVVFGVGLAKFMESVSDVIYGLCQKHERMDSIAISMSIKGLGSVAALVGVLRYTHNLVYAVLAMAGWWALLLLFVDLRWAHKFAQIDPADQGTIIPSFERKILFSLGVLALPMGIQTMLASLTTNIPRYVIQHDMGAAALGLYAAMAYFMLAGHTVIAAVGNSVQARLARHWQQSLPLFRRLLVRCAVFAFGMGALAGVIALGAGKPLLTLFYRPEYAKNHNAFTVLMFATGFYYVGSMLGAGVAVVRRFWLFTVLYASVPLVALTSSIVLVPRSGLMGAAIATLIFCVANAVVPMIVIAQAYRQRVGALPGVAPLSEPA
ncbi:polysaccharide biosynthesis protein [Candidatus Koribacter versatilis Ellin345]|uniref:Polysaccharide biosynthesis protein n=1 Tax=Koribacter versatilis (strain Ellin345) TaxID=204669 RepID=Q1ITF8_KORVE|nr:oligosaccharide flippase family protein [Candidatus Koribacter versatilis]ABF39842.1 polysaccharide biosynthesis protein [Candidatus Koribacter versatilis Ellin345]